MYCLYYTAPDVYRVQKGWRPAEECQRLPGCAQDHMHISDKTLEQLKTDNRLAVVDDAALIACLKGPGEQTAAA